jgi:GH24 family phage-related lysozyme (muramidase)
MGEIDPRYFAVDRGIDRRWGIDLADTREWEVEFAMMRISANGIALLREFEGLRLVAYQDPVGIWTIGFGHTKTVRPGQRISMERAEQLLREDLAVFERCVDRVVSVPLNRNEFDALVSWAFNVGCGAVARSTLVRKLNAGDRAGAADEFLRWNKAKGQVLRGLTIRRAEERGMYLTGCS